MIAGIRTALRHREVLLRRHRAPVFRPHRRRKSQQATAETPGADPLGTNPNHAEATPKLLGPGQLGPRLRAAVRGIGGPHY
jgi:hypothetical protein